MKIKFHYSYIIVALGFILSGYFSNIIIFTSIIIVHELGHIIMAKINNLKIDYITIYPYGGLLKMNNPINTNTKKELLLALGGIIFQIIFYLIVIILYKEKIIREYSFNLFTLYHTNILFFNLLPIHPLDGSKILNLLLSYIFPYKLTNILNIVISIITLSILLITNYYESNYTIIIIITIIINNLIKYFQELNYLFNKFLLERHLYNFKFPKSKVINKITHMYKNKYNIIKDKKNYFTEKEYLKQKYNINK